MTTTNAVKERLECIDAMNKLMIYVGSDEVFDEWLESMPGGLKEDVFMNIAEDDEVYLGLCDLFFELIEREGEAELW